MAGDFITFEGAEFQAQFLNLMRLAAKVNKDVVYSVSVDRTISGKFTIQVDDTGSSKLYYKNECVMFDADDGIGGGFKIPIELGKWSQIQLRVEVTQNRLKVSPLIFFGDGNYVKVGGGAGFSILIENFINAIRQPYDSAYNLKHKSPNELDKLGE